jgi:hypothetical protein
MGGFDRALSRVLIVALAATSARLSALGFVAYSLALFVGLPQLVDDRAVSKR